MAVAADDDNHGDNDIVDDFVHGVLVHRDDEDDQITFDDDIVSALATDFPSHDDDDKIDDGDDNCDVSKYDQDDHTSLGDDDIVSTAATVRPSHDDDVDDEFCNVDTISETNSENDLQMQLAGGFLDCSSAMHLLISKKVGLNVIPGGLKENVYFIVDNTKNFEGQATKNTRSYVTDDCGVWDSSAGTSPKFYYLLSELWGLSTVFLRQGKYCVHKMIKKKVEYVPLNPQPELSQGVFVHRYYTTLKLDRNYKKTVNMVRGA